MSYARFGSDGSDVYVFAAREGLECCGCILQAREWVDDPGMFLGGYLKAVGELVPYRFTTTAAMLDHLDRHLAVGHVVPSDCIERLKAEGDENDAEYRLPIEARWKR